MLVSEVSEFLVDDFEASGWREEEQLLFILDWFPRQSEPSRPLWIFVDLSLHVNSDYGARSFGNASQQVHALSLRATCSHREWKESKQVRSWACGGLPQSGHLRLWRLDISRASEGSMSAYKADGAVSRACMLIWLI